MIRQVNLQNLYVTVGVILSISLEIVRSGLQPAIEFIQSPEIFRWLVYLLRQLCAIANIVGIFKSDQERLDTPALVSGQSRKFPLEGFNAHVKISDGWPGLYHRQA